MSINAPWFSRCIVELFRKRTFQCTGRILQLRKHLKLLTPRSVPWLGPNIKTHPMCSVGVPPGTGLWNTAIEECPVKQMASAVGGKHLGDTYRTSPPEGAYSEVWFISAGGAVVHDLTSTYDRQFFFTETCIYMLRLHMHRHKLAVDKNKSVVWLTCRNKWRLNLRSYSGGKLCITWNKIPVIQRWSSPCQWYEDLWHAGFCGWHLCDACGDNDVSGRCLRATFHSGYQFCNI